MYAACIFYHLWYMLLADFMNNKEWLLKLEKCLNFQVKILRVLSNIWDQLLWYSLQKYFHINKYHIL